MRMFQLSAWCEKCVAARHYRYLQLLQLLNANDINRVRWVVLGLLQDGACTDFFENLSQQSLKGKGRPIEYHNFQPNSFLIGRYL